MCRAQGSMDIYEEEWNDNCPFYTCHEPIKYNLKPMVLDEICVCGGKR